jgi:hypothetical protein
MVIFISKDLLPQLIQIMFRNFLMKIIVDSKDQEEPNDGLLFVADNAAIHKTAIVSQLLK